MIAIVSGNIREYHFYLRDNNLDPNQYFYVSRIRDMRGKRNIDYILYGTYYKNELSDILDTAARLQWNNITFKGR